MEYEIAKRQVASYTLYSAVLGAFNVIAKDGRYIYIAHYCFNATSKVLLSCSDDFGRTWSTQEIATITYDSNAKKTVDMCVVSGTVYLCYATGTSVVFKKSTDHGDTWSTSTAISSATDYFCRIATDGSKIFINGGGKLAKSIDGGSTWTTNSSFPNAYVGLHFDGTALRWIVSEYSTGTYYYRYRYSTSDGATYTQKSIASTTGIAAIAPRLLGMCVKNGRISALLYKDAEYLLFVSLDEGAIWNSTVITSDDCYECSLYTDDDVLDHVLWVNTDFDCNYYISDSGSNVQVFDAERPRYPVMLIDMGVKYMAFLQTAPTDNNGLTIATFTRTFVLKYPQTGIANRVFPGQDFGLAPMLRDLYVTTLLKRANASTKYGHLLPGVCSVYNAQRADLPGVCSVYNAQRADLPGVCSVYNAQRADLPGVCSVMLPMQADLPGVSSVYRTFAGNDLPGMSSVMMSLTSDLTGLARVANDDSDRYELFIGVDAEPDLAGDPDETFTSLPHDVALTPPATGTRTYHMVTRRRNRWGVTSLNNLSTRVTIDAGGVVQVNPPRAPREIELIETAGYKVQITAIYDYPSDGDDQADTWLLYITTDGSTPDPDTDTPMEVAMVKTEATANLIYTTDELSLSTVVKVLVRVRRSGDPDVDSTNTTVSSLTVTGSSLAAVTQTESIMGSIAQVQLE